jgi:hypothetical protein
MPLDRRRRGAEVLLRHRCEAATLTGSYVHIDASKVRIR